MCHTQTPTDVCRESPRRRDASGGMIQLLFPPSSPPAQPDLLKDFPHYLLLNCPAKRTLKVKSSKRFDSPHFGSPMGGCSVFLEAVRRFSSAEI